jgi:hypothetical protein
MCATLHVWTCEKLQRLWLVRLCVTWLVIFFTKPALAGSSEHILRNAKVTPLRAAAL